MPLIETHVMAQRIQFIGDWLSGQCTKTEQCEHYHSSRPTGDKLIERYRCLGLGGINDRSRAAKHPPNAVPDAVCERMVRDNWLGAEAGYGRPAPRQAMPPSVTG